MREIYIFSVATKWWELVIFLTSFVPCPCLDLTSSGTRNRTRGEGRRLGTSRGAHILIHINYVRQAPVLLLKIEHNCQTKQNQ